MAITYKQEFEKCCASGVQVVLSGTTDKEIFITDVQFIGSGCEGNQKAVSQLCQYRDIDDVIKSLIGIKCGKRGTSCADQLAKALVRMKEMHCENIRKGEYDDELINI